MDIIISIISNSISIAKTVAKACTENLIYTKNFLVSEIVFYFYKSITPLLLLIATFKSWISCRDGCAGLLLVLHVLLVLNHHRWNSVSPQELFWTADVYLHWLNWCHFPYCRGRSTNYSDRLHGCSVACPRCYKDISVNSFFPRTAWFWNSLPVECLTLELFVSGLWNTCLWFFNINGSKFTVKGTFSFFIF